MDGRQCGRPYARIERQFDKLFPLPELESQTLKLPLSVRDSVSCKFSSLDAGRVNVNQSQLEGTSRN